MQDADPPFRISGAERRLGLFLAFPTIMRTARALSSVANEVVKPDQSPIVPTSVEEDIQEYRLVADRYGLAFARADELLALADPELARLVPGRFLERQHVVPLFKSKDDRLVVATSDPRIKVPELAYALGAREVEQRVVTPSDLVRIQETLDARQRDSARAKATREPATANGSSRHTSESEYTKALDSLLTQALAARATDLHLERYGERVRVRLRVDGDLRDAERVRLTVDQMEGLLNVVKVRAGLDIGEHRTPQGGRFVAVLGGRQCGVGAQTQLTLHGEQLALRLLPEELEHRQLRDMGFSETLAWTFSKDLESRQGLVLVTGPTGGGKTTTLYGGLRALAADKKRKVITIEDPIEASVDDIQQSQVASGFGFADAMRAFTYQDADVIFLGELRDAQSAAEAIRASQTGRLVLSSLHSRDTLDAIRRLRDLEVDAESIAAELVGVYAQRLAKRICGHCRTAARPDPELASEVFPAGPPADFACFDGRGCELCDGQGTRGRIAVVEYLPASAPLRKAIAQNAARADLLKVAHQSGFLPMRNRMLELIRSGFVRFNELKPLRPFDQL